MPLPFRFNLCQNILVLKLEMKFTKKSEKIQLQYSQYLIFFITFELIQ